MVKLLPIILLCSCSFGINTMGYDKNSMTLEDAWKITSQFEYQNDMINYWKSPAQFEEDGGGDCEDFCIYMMYLMGEDSGIEMVGIITPDNIPHAIIKYKGKLIEPQTNGKYLPSDYGSIVYTRDYFYVMAKATEFGTKSVH